jgi:phthalate 4,5-cis-dihydrodiol dehydrogenase
MATLTEQWGPDWPPSRVMRVGIAGLGVASAQVLPGIERMAHVRIVAGADVRESALDAFRQKYDGRVYRNVADLCADADVDVIWVNTPNQFHCEHVEMAADHGKHVICTKPMALSVEECERMVSAAGRNQVRLLSGHTNSLSPDIQAMWQVVRSGELGRLIAINCWMYTDWLLKPRMPEEVDESLGGGVVYRHGPHLIDTIRLLGGGMVRSVRATVGRWMPERPAPGNFSAYLEFEDGTPATIAYNGYGYFDTSELTWGIGNRWYTEPQRVRIRHALRSGAVEVEQGKEGMRFGASNSDDTSTADAQDAPRPEGLRAHAGWFGITVASFERGDVRQSPNGLYVYNDEGRREIPVYEDPAAGRPELQELWAALTKGEPISHDGRWGTATLEVAVAIVQSGRERREVMLEHQCPLAESSAP